MAQEPKEDKFVKLEETLSRTELYIEDNQKKLTIIIVAIALLVAGYMSYNKFVAEPAEYRAQQEIFAAQQYFAKDSFNLALNGDGNYSGFLYIIDNYGRTKAGNLANYYAGICYLRTGDFNNAITYLKEFGSDDVVIAPIALGGIGDAYMELGNTEEAISYYLKAAKESENMLTAPHYLMKAGIAYEIAGNYSKALETYTALKKDYSESQQGRLIEKYIARATQKL